MRGFFLRAALLAAPVLVTFVGLLGLTGALGDVGGREEGPLAVITLAGVAAIYLCWYVAFRLRALSIGEFKPHRALDRATLWGTATLCGILLTRCAF